MTWAELIEMNKRRLNYLSAALTVKDKDVKVKFKEEYPYLISAGKIRPTILILKISIMKIVGNYKRLKDIKKSKD